MLQATLVGNVGADAVKQSKDGHNFTSFRVAHNERWTDAAGQVHDSTKWIDVILNDHPKVADFIKQGQSVLVQGSIDTRIYSSAKDRCMKAGLTIRNARVELLGGATDAVPSRLYDDNGVQHDVKKYYGTDIANAHLVSMRGHNYTTDANGWVVDAEQKNTDNQASAPNAGGETAQSDTTNIQ